jgi:hypothetical protein
MPQATQRETGEAQGGLGRYGAIAPVHQNLKCPLMMPIRNPAVVYGAVYGD